MTDTRLARAAELLEHARDYIFDVAPFADSRGPALLDEIAAWIREDASVEARARIEKGLLAGILLCACRHPDYHHDWSGCVVCECSEVTYTATASPNVHCNWCSKPTPREQLKPVAGMLACSDHCARHLNV